MMKKTVYFIIFCIFLFSGSVFNSSKAFDDNVKQEVEKISESNILNSGKTVKCRLLYSWRRLSLLGVRA